MRSKKWIVCRTIWPYPEGYGVISKNKRIIIDTGLSKEEAQNVCDEMNKKQIRRKECQ